MNEFTSLRITKEVAVRFRKVAHELMLIHSEALKVLMDQWEKNNGKLYSIESNRIINEMVPHIEKNTNRLVKILKSIEKDKINHIHALIYTLFTAGTSKNSGNLSETKNATKPTPSKQKFEEVYTLIELRHQKTSLEWEVREVKTAFLKFLEEKIIVFNPRIGNKRLEVQLSLEELEALKQQYKTKEDVHHH